MRFQNRTVVITGAGSGIGLAAARRFHSEGANVVLADINGDRTAQVARELGDERSLGLCVNVGDWNQVHALMERAADHFGGPDILFNNAAIGFSASIPQMRIEDWQRVVEIDLSSVFYGCKAAIPLMRNRGGGAIINTASSSGLAGDYGAAAYCAAKGGVINFTRAAAIDHAHEGIRVNAVCPGIIETAILGGLNHVAEIRARWEECVPMGRFGTADEIASVVAFLASEDAAYVTGSIISVDGGLLAQTGQPNFPKLLKRVAAEDTAQRT